MTIEEMLNAIVNAAKRDKSSTIESIYNKILAKTKVRINLNFNCVEGYSPLFWAAGNGHLNVVKTLIELGAKPNFLSKGGLTALHTAAQNGKFEVVKFLLYCAPNLIDMRDMNNNLAVDYADDSNEDEAKKILAYLILNGANINHFYKELLLIDFARFPWGSGVLEYLIRQGVDINACNQDDGFNALMTACAFGCKENVDLLLREGANISLKNNENKTAMKIAQSNGFSVIRQKLMSAMYQQYQEYGKTLNTMPKTHRQTTPSCGFFAASCATYHYYELYPGRFSRLLYAPEKKYKDDGKYFAENVSLRSLRNHPEINIQGKGEIFTHAELRKVISLNQCSAETYDVDSYNKFVEYIVVAICANRPVIIPFSNGSKQSPDQPYPGVAAHWATIIGYRMEKDILYIMIAENGTYTEFSAAELFDRFYNIEDICEEVKLYKIADPQKRSQTKAWVTAPFGNIGSQTLEEIALQKHTVHETNLSEFRRKLTVVAPPAP